MKSVKQEEGITEVFFSSQKYPNYNKVKFGRRSFPIMYQIFRIKFVEDKGYCGLKNILSAMSRNHNYIKYRRLKIAIAKL